MRFGTWRGVTLAVALAVITAGSARANDPFHHSIPKEVEAIDLNTGGPYYAPPIPYGHYAKDGLVGKLCGCLMSPFHSLAGLGHGLGGLGHGCKACGACGGKGCGLCGGRGMICGEGAGHGGHGGHGWGHGGGDPGCAGGNCGGLGLGHGKRFEGCGLCGGKGCGICTRSVLATAQAAPGVATTAAPQVAPQVIASDPGCGVSGCKVGGGHKHLGGGGGLGCLHGPGGRCGNCAGDPGLGHGHGHGHGIGNGHGGGTGCPHCGGAGCGHCMGKGGHGLGGLGLLKGSVYGLLHPHAGKVEYFVGPGGPVPITPGYVPYVNPVRSPRDYFAFPPFTGQ